MSVSRRSFLIGSGAAMAVASGAVVLGATPAGAYGWTRTLQQGSSGADVKELQVRVAGYAAASASKTYVALDGVFGAGTAGAVKRFQSSHGLTADGVVGPATQAKLNALEKSDGSTAHFAFSEFWSHDGVGFSNGKVAASTVKANVRVLMWKLEALRQKSGNRAITINSGFRSVAYNASVGGTSNSQHMYGIGADVVVSGQSTLATYKIAETCGFSGLEAYTHSWQHCDSRVQYPYGAQSWWWESGMV